MENYSLEWRDSNHGEWPPHRLPSCLFTAKAPCASTSEHAHTATNSHLLNCQAVISASGLVTRFGLLAADLCKGKCWKWYANHTGNKVRFVFLLHNSDTKLTIILIRYRALFFSCNALCGLIIQHLRLYLISEQSDCRVLCKGQEEGRRWKGKETQAGEVKTIYGVSITLLLLMHISLSLDYRNMDALSCYRSW